MRHARAAAALVCALTQVGCATILTGTRQKVAVEPSPPQAVTVAVGGPAGQLVRYAKKGDEISRVVLDFLRPHASPQLMAQLSALELPELVAQLAAALHTGAQSPELSDLRAALAVIPKPVIDQLLQKAGLEAVASGAFELDLRKGTPYAVVTWQQGYRAKLATIDVKFNWVVLLNVLTLGLGVPVDILTGAWFKLTPDKLDLVLEERGPPATASTAAPP